MLEPLSAAEVEHKFYICILDQHDQAFSDVLAACYATEAQVTSLTRKNKEAALMVITAE